MISTLLIKLPLCPPVAISQAAGLEGEIPISVMGCRVWLKTKPTGFINFISSGEEFASDPPQP